MSKRTVFAWPKEKNADKNPYNKILYGSIGNDFIVKEFNRKKFKPCQGDILHIHWPDHMLRLSSSMKIRFRLWRFFGLIKRLHKAEGKLVWTVHNFQPHQIHHPELAAEGIKKIADITDGFIFLSEVSRKGFFDYYPHLIDIPSAVIPHIHYRDYYKKSNKQLALDKLIKNSKPIQLLCFGVIRNHKGYEKLFDVAAKTECCNDVGWIVAGNPGKDGICDELEKAWKSNHMVYKACRHIQDREISDLFSIADAVVLPYESILNSGTAILALSLDRKVIAPAIGSLIELQKIVGAEWIHLYSQPLDSKKLEDAIRWVQSSVVNNKLKPNLDMMSPSIVAKTTSRFYHKITGIKNHSKT